MVSTMEDDAPVVLGVAISMLTLGGLFIFARVLTRTVIKPQFGLDDAFIVVTWVCSSINYGRRNTDNALPLVHHAGLWYCHVRRS
jgi:hypothetical protein